MGALPFESFEIEAGTEGDTRQHVATLKALVRLTGIDPSTGRPEPLPAADLELLDALSTPREYVVRVYVLRGLSLIPQDSGGTSDPYLQLTLGTTKVDNRSAHLSKVKSAAAHLFTSFELRTHLPGDSLLEVSVLDHDMFGRASDDLIGTTRIDLEDRVFSPTWQGMQVAPTPVEWRPLYAPISPEVDAEATARLATEAARVVRMETRVPTRAVACEARVGADMLARGSVTLRGPIARAFVELSPRGARTASLEVSSQRRGAGRFERGCPRPARDAAAPWPSRWTRSEPTGDRTSIPGARERPSPSTRRGWVGEGWRRRHLRDRPNPTPNPGRART